MSAPVMTPDSGLKRYVARPAICAGLATYLLSPESGIMTGALIDYDQHVLGAYLE